VLHKLRSSVCFWFQLFLDLTEAAFYSADGIVERRPVIRDKFLSTFHQWFKTLINDLCDYFAKLATCRTTQKLAQPSSNANYSSA
jgi:hypothetical protein